MLSKSVPIFFVSPPMCVPRKKKKRKYKPRRQRKPDAISSQQKKNMKTANGSQNMSKLQYMATLCDHVSPLCSSVTNER